MTVPRHVAVDRLDGAAGRRLGALIGGAVPAVAPALAVCVWQAGGCRYEAHAGWLDPERPGDPVHEGALFDLASLTKLFTAAAFLGLVAEGRVALDDRVSRVIPESSAGGERAVDGGEEPLTRRPLPVAPERAGMHVDASVMTFRQLLTHSSGMAPWRSVFRAAGPVPPPPDRPDARSIEERWEAGLAAAYAYPFVAPPGEEVRYSDLGFMALGDAVHRLAQKPLDVAIRKRVAERLGLGSLCYRPLAAGVPRSRIAPTSVDEDWRRRRCHGEVEDENAAGLGGVAGHAGLFATARDIARFGEAWRQGDAGLGIGDLLRREATSDQTPRLNEARGLGWQVQPADHLAPFGRRAYGHTGFTGTSLAVDPDRELVVVLLTNRVWASRRHEGIDALRLDLHRTLAGVRW